MININNELQRLQWLREWMNQRIDHMALPYGFKQWVYVGESQRFDISDNFEHYCAYELHKQMINN